MLFNPFSSVLSVMLSTAALIVLLFLIAWVCDIIANAREAAKKQARFQELLKKAKSGDEDSQWTLVKERWTSPNPETEAQLVAYRHAMEVDQAWKRSGWYALSAYEEWQANLGSKKEIDSLARFIRTYSDVSVPEVIERLATEKNIKPDIEALKAQLQQLVQISYKKLCDGMRDDADVLLALRELISETQERWTAVVLAGVTRLEYPEGYDQAVASLFLNPAPSLFAAHKEPQRGDLRIWAGEALESDDIVGIKKVLGYVDRSHRWNEELGAVLLAELTMREAKYNAKLEQVESEDAH